MDYIYDIVLNFQNYYYDFFEWKSSDKVINVKKILVYKTNSEDYLNLKYNEVILDTKDLPKQTKMFLVTNGSEVMGILLDNKGKIIKKSSLLFDEADEILEEGLTLEEQSKRLGFVKAKSVFDKTSGDRIVIGSDTLVAKDGKLLGKPKDKQDAINMLNFLKRKSLYYLRG